MDMTCTTPERTFPSEPWGKHHSGDADLTLFLALYNARANALTGADDGELAGIVRKALVDSSAALSASSLQACSLNECWGPTASPLPGNGKGHLDIYADTSSPCDLSSTRSTSFSESERLETQLPLGTPSAGRHGSTAAALRKEGVGGQAAQVLAAPSPGALPLPKFIALGELNIGRHAGETPAGRSIAPHDGPDTSLHTLAGESFHHPWCVTQHFSDHPAHLFAAHCDDRVAEPYASGIASSGPANARENGSARVLRDPSASLATAKFDMHGSAQAKSVPFCTLPVGAAPGQLTMPGMWEHSDPSMQGGIWPDHRLHSPPLGTSAPIRRAIEPPSRLGVPAPSIADDSYTEFTKRPWDTTLIVRNMPKGSKPLLMWPPTEYHYNLMHSPYSFTQRRMVSYVILNFTTHEAASAFHFRWHGQALMVGRSAQRLSICTANVQGLFANLRLMESNDVHLIRNPKYLPLVFDAAGSKLDFWQVLATIAHDDKPTTDEC